MCSILTNWEVFVKFRAMLKSGVPVKVLGIAEAKNLKTLVMCWLDQAQMS